MTVGNDVVDLSDVDADPATFQPGFDRRVFRPEERSWLAAAEAPNRLRWGLWAAKEAAYKAMRKADPETVFSPKRMQVDLAPEALCLLGAGDELAVRVEGAVRFGALRCELSLTVLGALVHAIAHLGEPRGVICDVRRVADPTCEASGQLARALVAESLAAPLGVRPDALEVRKEGRVPRLWCAGEPTAIDLSISHHGAFVAFAASGALA